MRASQRTYLEPVAHEATSIVFTRSRPAVFELLPLDKQLLLPNNGYRLMYRKVFFRKPRKEPTRSSETGVTRSQSR